MLYYHTHNDSTKHKIFVGAETTPLSQIKNCRVFMDRDIGCGELKDKLLVVLGLYPLASALPSPSPTVEDKVKRAIAISTSPVMKEIFCSDQQLLSVLFGAGQGEALFTEAKGDFFRAIKKVKG